jgi:hypothetical protein
MASGIIPFDLKREQTAQLIPDRSVDDLKGVKMWVDGTGHYARPDVLRLVHDRTCRSHGVDAD